MKTKWFTFPLVIIVLLTSCFATWIIGLYTRITPTNWSPIVTLLAVMSAWLIPVVFNYYRNKRRRKAIEASVALYLDSLEIKLNLVINGYYELYEGIPSGRSSFEFQNKENYDAIEHLFKSEYLKAKEREELMKLIRYFKIFPGMEEVGDFEDYLKEVKKPSLRKYFPRATDLASKTDEAINLKKRKWLRENPCPIKTKENH